VVMWWNNPLPPASANLILTHMVIETG
jgi:hypothetical protein